MLRTFQCSGQVESLRHLLVALLIGIALLGTRAGSPASAQTPDGGLVSRSTESAELWFDPSLPDLPDLAPDLFVTNFGEEIDSAISELSLVFGMDPVATVDVWIGTETGADAVAVFDPERLALIVDGPALTGRTEIEATNALRDAVARRLLWEATGSNMAPLFVEGMGMYAQRPLTPVISRHAANLQNANSQGALLSWADLNRIASGETLGSDLAESSSYAVTAWLIDHFGISAYQQYLAAFQATDDWRVAIAAAYGAPANDIERLWRENLTRWTNNGWKTNVIAGFDLDPARTLLERGNYAAAKASLERSQRLFNELDDDVNQSVVLALLDQSEVGLQAENLMVQTEAALRQHNYARASDLIAQAEAQYARMPPDQRPESVIADYRARSEAGLQAIGQLENAERLVNSWTEFPAARNDAIAAGRSFAELGDVERLASAEVTLDRIDERVRRLTFLLGGLSFISLVWLLLWRKHGADLTMRWPERVRNTGAVRRNG